MVKKPQILVCPLDWGIGHATRIVPVIHELLDQNAHVILAASGRAYYFLEQEFPEMELINFEGYDILYPENGQMQWSMIKQTPKILRKIRKERKQLHQIIKNKKIDAVISDNRFGLSSHHVPCIFITHQLFIQAVFFKKFTESLLEIINRHYFSRFSEIWIPDVAKKPNLSGILSHRKKIKNAYFIGPLSRFRQPSNDLQQAVEFELLVILSGPEPQRTLLEKILIKQIRQNQIKAALVRGVTEEKNFSVNQQIKVFSHLPTAKLKQLILKSDIVLSRPGYSTIMDLVCLNKKAIFIPTPGQTEQIYLAKKFKRDKAFYFEYQNDFNLERSMMRSKKYNGISIDHADEHLKERVSSLLDAIR